MSACTGSFLSMSVLALTASRAVSRHLRLRHGKPRSAYYAWWRDGQGLYHERKLRLVRGDKARRRPATSTPRAPRRRCKSSSSRRAAVPSTSGAPA